MTCRSSLLFVAPLGDPIASIVINDAGAMAGTLLGQVLLRRFTAGSKVEQLAAYAEEGIRGLFLTEALCYATTLEGSMAWQSRAPYAVSATAQLLFRNLDRKLTQNVKFMMQRGPIVCALFPTSSLCVDVVKQTVTSTSQFKLFDVGSLTEVAVCDFDGQRLMLIDRSNAPEPAMLRLINLEMSEQLEFSSLPSFSRMSLLRLWGSDRIVYVVGTQLFVYDILLHHLRYVLKGHRAEIVAVDSHDPGLVVTLSSDATLKFWTGKDGECIKTLRIREATYFQGFPYHVQVHGSRCLASADQGVFLVELESDVGGEELV